MSDSKPTVQIITDGVPGEGTQVLVERDGEDPVDIASCITSVRWRMDAGDRQAQADLTVRATPLEASGEVTWHGLEDVPVEALQEELARRKNQQ